MSKNSKLVRLSSLSIGALLVSLGAVACIEPSGREDQPHPSPLPPRGDDAALVMSAWQEIIVSFEISNDHLPRPEIVGFDKVKEIFDRPAYGPCSLCHTQEWPYLDAKGWPRFLDSIVVGEHVMTKEELSALVVGCVDVAMDQHCAGDSADSSDNIDFKMPSKFGYDALNAEELRFLNDWLAGGVQEFSSAARPGFRPEELTAVEIQNAYPKTLEPRDASIPLEHSSDGEVWFAVKARFAGTCVDAFLTARVLSAGHHTLISTTIPIPCDGNRLAENVQTNFLHR